MRRALPASAAVLVLAALPGCALLRNLGQAIRAPTATFESAALESISLDAATVRGQFRLQNPNPIGLSVADVQWSFLLEGERMFGGRAPAGVHLAPQGAAPLPIQIAIPFSGLAKFAQLAASTREEVPYRVEGTVGVQTPIGVLQVPVAWNGVLPIPRLPAVSVVGASIASVSLTGARAVVTLAVDNRNAFPLPLEALGVRLVANNQVLASAGLAAPQPLAARQVAQLQLPIDIGFVQAGTAAASGLMARSLAVRVQGEAKVAGRSLPLDLATTLR